MPDRPNILFVFTDQQSASAMSCAGQGWLHTPGMDRLAAEGVRFGAAYCSFPLCTPSRASMFAGRWPHEIGVRWNEDCMTPQARANGVGNLLSSAGYDCAYGGKWHIPWASPMEAGHGFDYVNAFDDFTLADDVLAWIAQRPADRPWFAVASFDDPHSICEYSSNRPLPWGPTPVAPSLADCPPLPPNFHGDPYEPAACRGVRREDYTPDDWRRYLYAYGRVVERVDARIAKLLAGLDAAGPGVVENTVVIFSSDHGDNQAARHMTQKITLYDESVRVPLIVSAPAGRRGATDGRLVRAGVDVYATVCDYAGVQPPAGWARGRSLRPIVEGVAAEDWPDVVFAETCSNRKGNQGRMVRTERYKYMAYEHGANREALYDLSVDPHELVNLAACSRHAVVLQQHRGRLRAWCAETGDDFGYHYTHPAVPFLVPGDEYPPDSGGLPEGFEAPNSAQVHKPRPRE